MYEMNAADLENKRKIMGGLNSIFETDRKRKILITIDEGKVRYGVSRKEFVSLSKEAGAYCVVHNDERVNVNMFEKWLEQYRTPAPDSYWEYVLKKEAKERFGSSDYYSKE